MVNTLISKQVDIYRYPDEIEENSGSITIGDIHGNTVKLTHFLLRHNVIKFKDTVADPADAYQTFVDLYEQSGEITQLFLDTGFKLRTEEKNIQRYTVKIARYDELAGIARDQNQEREFAGLNRLTLVQGQQESLQLKATLQAGLAIAAQGLPAMLAEFEQFIDQIEVADRNTLVRLIGDELADRGSNDYFTLRLLGLLHAEGVDVNITISNHSNEFITAYENLINNDALTPSNVISDVQKPSFFGLKILYDAGLVTKDEITQLVNIAYKPSLKLIDYTLNEQGITLFTHAPVRFDVIRNIAHSVGVVYNDSSKEALATTIDKINSKFTQIVDENRVREYCNTNGIDDPANMTLADIAQTPLMNLIWNRWNKNKDTADARPDSVNGYQVRYYHGHDSYQSSYQHINNMDTSCGKESRKSQQERIDQARQAIQGNSADKIAAQNYLDGITLYKVLASDERSLNQKHEPELIDQEYTQAAAVAERAGFFVRLFIAVGIVLGATLLVSGLLAPLGLGLLGTVAAAVIAGGGTALLGYGAAKMTEPAPINTVTTLDEETDPFEEDNSPTYESSSVLAQLSTSSRPVKGQKITGVSQDSTSRGTSFFDERQPVTSVTMDDSSLAKGYKLSKSGDE